MPLISDRKTGTINYKIHEYLALKGQPVKLAFDNEYNGYQQEVYFHLFRKDFYSKFSGKHINHNSGQ